MAVSELVNEFPSLLVSEFPSLGKLPNESMTGFILSEVACIS